ncbi:MAG: aromatic ring-hydroxylating dioxygenase subunit alpha [Burkholderiales bacterium]|nr:aromatic ring-hydroxylating dioxygenase subunit alpha [Burkholderiales bacterium]
MKNGSSSFQPGSVSGELPARRAAVLPCDYHLPEVFERERERIFRGQWTFACLAGELPEPGDFRLIDAGGVEAVVRNCAGTLKAFVNTCSHRHSRIFEEPQGNRKLVCPYHGWVYDEDGVPRAIPRAQDFPQVIAAPSRFALRQLDLECAGRFAFVRAERRGGALREFLGEAWDFLHSVSAGLGERMDAFRGTIAANWKVVIENALEGYHVPMVHRETLGAIRQLSARSADIVDHLPEGAGHSWMVNKADPQWLRRWSRYERALGKWPFRFEHYVHQLVFPNLTVTSFMGYSFHVQHFIAEAAERTSVAPGSAWCARWNTLSLRDKGFALGTARCAQALPAASRPARSCSFHICRNAPSTDRVTASAFMTSEAASLPRSEDRSARRRCGSPARVIARWT